MTDKYCTVYIRSEENSVSPQDIERALKEGKVEDKIKAIKSLVIAIIHDETFPRMIMTIISNVVPV
jgi:vesicle coat complex subunit